MDEDLKEYIDWLNQKGIDAAQLPSCEIDSYKHKWFDTLVPAQKRADALGCHCFDEMVDFGGHMIISCGYPWHLFSYKILNCKVGKRAKKRFNSLRKEEAILLVNIDDYMFEIADASKITAEDLDEGFLDVILTAQDFSWAYSKTHEPACGPYLYVR
ncbi:DUF4275 family protein [Eubacteriales bacterium OttesenSCG-928-N14]|nr:DUF4275 family protein [Eubacteriales bacterium OttesenSCG-928-N14]